MLVRLPQDDELLTKLFQDAKLPPPLMLTRLPHIATLPPPAETPLGCEGNSSLDASETPLGELAVSPRKLRLQDT